MSTFDDILDTLIGGDGGDSSPSEDTIDEYTYGFDSSILNYLRSMAEERENGDGMCDNDSDKLEIDESEKPEFNESEKLEIDENDNLEIDENDNLEVDGSSRNSKAEHNGGNKQSCMDKTSELDPLRIESDGDEDEQIDDDSTNGPLHIDENSELDPLTNDKNNELNPLTSDENNQFSPIKSDDEDIQFVEKSTEDDPMPDFKPNQLVWARLRYCQYWPARVIIEPPDVIDGVTNEKICVFFFGSKTICVVPRWNVKDYMEHRTKYMSKPRTEHLTLAIQQIEEYIQDPIAHELNASVDNANRVVVLKTEREPIVKCEMEQEPEDYQFYRVSCVERTDAQCLLHRMTLERRQMIKQMNRMNSIIAQKDMEIASLKSKMLQMEQENQRKSTEADEKVQVPNYPLEPLIDANRNVMRVDDQIPGTSTGAHTPYGVITSPYGSTKIKIEFSPGRVTAQSDAARKAKRHAKKAKRKQKRSKSQKAHDAGVDEPMPSTSTGTVTTRMSAPAAKRIKIEFAAADIKVENVGVNKQPKRRGPKPKASNARVAKKASRQLLRKIKTEPDWKPPSSVASIVTTYKARAERTSLRKARGALTEMCVPEPTDVPIVITDEGEALYEVESIREHRICGDRVDFRIRWKGYSNEHDEWVEYSKMACGLLLNNYLKEKRLYFDASGQLQEDTDNNE